MDNAQPSGEKKLTLLLLCWLFGLFSVHRFYTGKYFSGGLQLLTFVTASLLGAFDVKMLGIIAGAVGGIWLIMDVMLIIMGRFTDGRGFLVIRHLLC